MILPPVAIAINCNKFDNIFKILKILDIKIFLVILNNSIDSYT
jgi:hypothetical protein